MMSDGRQRCHRRHQQQHHHHIQRQQKYPIGTRFWKHFGQYGVFEGRVESYDEETEYYVKYSDGDAEHLGEDDLGELIEKSEEDMMRVRNLGKKSLKEVKQKLEEMNLSLAKH